MEIVCIDKGETEGSLQNRLTSLAERGVIPEKLVNVASQLRQLRNIGAHAYLGDLTPGDVPAVDALCRALLEYVYTAPELIKQVETKLRKRKKKSPRKRKNKAK